MLKAKILVLGPCESGKSALSNFLADATETSAGEYKPTQGVRILEFEVNDGNIRNRNGVEVELWDCSGDLKFEACWPAIARDTNGIVFVYNPDQPNHDKDLEIWYKYFVEQQGIKDSHCLVAAHHKPEAPARERTRLSELFSNIPCIKTNIEEEADEVREEFSKYLGKLCIELSDKREQEELSIMNQR